ncbi:stage III sporulation protein AG [uncultured Clostridium sp.]|jgi:stage III sporulation protein AG|uniref:stage III sporulation protein AG n=1 Tax=uncultured Clostridium sp. TaxID=59620 RepID=UPI00261F412D|nr:stage III sporulation protein AG [uncultured Clostridium sp.]
MDKDKFNSFLEKISKNKKIAPLVILVLILILVCFSLSYLKDVNNISNSEKNNLNGNAEVDFTQAPVIDHEYEQVETKELQEILSKIEGVGTVEVKLRFGGSEIKVPATDSNSQQSKTEEVDSEGGQRVNNEATDGDKVVMKNDDGGNAPYILETKKPEVIGVMVVAEGAGNSKIKYEIGKAISSLYDISLEDVSIFSMEEENK